MGAIAGLSVWLPACGQASRTVAMAGSTRITQSQVSLASKASQVLQGTILNHTAQAARSQAMAVAEQAAVIQWGTAHHMASWSTIKNQASRWLGTRIIPAAGGSAAFARRLSQAGLSRTDLVNFVANQLYLQAIYDHITQSAPTPSLAAQQRYYNANSAFFIAPPEVLVRNITVKSAAQAQAILRQLQAGASFSALALRDSLDPNRSQGGSRGWVELGASQGLPKAWISALPNLHTGRMSIVQSALGYSIIEVQASRAGAAIPFHAVQPAIQTELVQSEKSTLFDHWAATVMNRTQVRVFSS